MMKWIGLFVLMVVAAAVGFAIYDFLRGKKIMEQMALVTARFNRRKRIGFKAEMEASPAAA